jgi:hypothetical protein
LRPPAGSPLPPSLCSGSTFRHPLASPNAERPAQSINPTTNTHPTTTITTTSPNMGLGRIDAGGRINWWRLYQTPPIVSPRAAGVAVGHTGGSGSGSGLNTDAHASTGTIVDAQATMAGTTSVDPAINSNNTKTATSLSCAFSQLSPHHPPPLCVS